MARIRYLKPEFFTDEDLAELPLEARLLFAGLWCHADRAGRLEDRPKFLKAMIFPYDQKIDIDKFLELLNTVRSDGQRFINRYKTDDGRCFISIPSWSRHQSPHHTERASVIPEPPHTPQDKDKEKDKEKRASPLSELSNRSITVKQPLKVKHLDFVYLFPEEYEKLIERFGEQKTLDKIEVLNLYLGSNGKRYKSHYHTLLNWDRMEKEKNKHTKPVTGEDIDQWMEQHSKT